MGHWYDSKRENFKKAIGYEITFSGVPDETETSHYDYMIKKKEGE